MKICLKKWEEVNKTFGEPIPWAPGLILKEYDRKPVVNNNCKNQISLFDYANLEGAEKTFKKI